MKAQFFFFTQKCKTSYPYKLNFYIDLALSSATNYFYNLGDES
jgi:hypothetical protein